MFLVGFLLPLIFYPIIAYKIYITKKNTMMAMNKGETVSREKDRERMKKNTVLPLKSGAAKRPSVNERLVFHFQFNFRTVYLLNFYLYCSHL